MKFNLFVFVTLLIAILIVGMTFASKKIKHVKNIMEEETYGYCVPTWPSKCFDCDAQMCSGQHKTQPALASSGLPNLGRM